MSDSFYRGFWIDWGKGPAHRLILTLSVRDAGILISFLTIFVRFVGNQMWNILRFALHQFRSSPGVQDGLYYQQQATLRNEASPGKALLDLVTLGWSWRSHARGSIRRSITIVLITFIQLWVWVLIGIFVSRFVTSSNEALVSHGTCGYWMNDLTSSSANYAAAQNAKGMLERSLSYGKDCYWGNVSTSGCQYYTVPSLNYTVNDTYACPFTDDLTCMDWNNIQIDTGLIDSNKHLGINARPENSVQYRKLTTCAPLNILNFTSNPGGSTWDDSFVPGPAGSIPGDKYLYYYLGPSVNATSTVVDYTWSINNYTLWNNLDAYYITVAESVLDDRGAGGSTAFIPNSTFFNQTDQDLQLIFLVNSAFYTAPVNDSWFLASTPYKFGDIYGDPTRDDASGTGYGPDVYGASVLACMEQHTFCNPNLGDTEASCTKLTGRKAVSDVLSDGNGSKIQLNTVQWATALRILQIIDYLSIRQIVVDLAASALDASTYLDYGIYDHMSMPLPNYQWQTEVLTWHHTAMANLQRWTFDYASGPALPDNEKYVKYPSSPEEVAMCSNQRARFTNAASFNGAIVILILGLGSIVIVTNFLLPSVVGFLQKYFDKGQHARIDWDLDELLQLQSMAYARSGKGTWRRKSKAVPLTLSDEKFDHLRSSERVFCEPSTRVLSVTEYQYESVKTGRS